MLVALVGMTACSSDDDNNENNGDTPVNHDFTGYIFVTSRYFQDMYYGNNATLKVYTEDNQYKVEFHDPQWGDVTFENVTLSPQLSGTGKLSMNYQGKDGSYDAVLSGSMMMPIISMPDVMGGTTITFYAGDAPLACELNGNHLGLNIVMVGDGYGPYEVNATYKISANPDGTLNLTIPEYAIDDTPIGDLTIGKSTIKNIAYDEEKQAFYRLYGADEMTEHFKAVMNGQTTMDSDYPFSADSYIQIELTESGIKVINHFSLGRMPFPINCTFSEDTASEVD